MKGIIAAFVIASLAMSGHAEASNRHCNKVVVAKVIQPTVLQAFGAYNPYHYAVGGHLQEEAVAEKIAQKVLAKIQAAGVRAQEQPQPVNELLLTKCAKCHNGNDKKGGLDITAELDCETKLEAIRRVVLDPSKEGHMPKNGALTPQEIGDLIGELSGVKDDAPVVFDGKQEF